MFNNQLIVLLCLAGLLGLVGAERLTYDQLDDYLIENVLSADVEANLEAAKSWDKTVSRITDRELKESIQQFIALGSLEDLCSRESYELLRRNRETCARSRRYILRVRPIVDQFIVRCAKQCLGAHELELAKAQAQLDQVQLGRVQVFLGGIVKGQVEASSGNYELKWTPLEGQQRMEDFSDFSLQHAIAQSLYHLDYLADFEFVRDALAYLSRHEPSRPIEQRLDEYLVRPCEHVLAHLQKDLLMVRPEIERILYYSELRNTVKLRLKLLLGLAAVENCQVLIEEKERIIEGLKALPAEQ